MGAKVPISAEMDDGRVLRGSVDQRDFARAEAQEINPDARATWVRFLAFSVLSRTKQYGGTWEQFNENDCVEAIDGDQEEPAGADDGLDPGRKGPTDAS